MTRLQSLLAAALVVQVLLIVLTRGVFGTGGGTSEPRALVPELDGFEPTRVEVVDHEGNEIQVVKSEGTWAIEDLGGYPADPNKVDKLLNDLKSTEVTRPVVKSRRYHASLGVADDDFQRRLRMWDTDSGDPKVDVFLGTAPNVGQTHVRVQGQDEVYETDRLASYDVRAEESAWITGRFFNGSPEQIGRFRVQNASGTFELEKQEGEWVVASPSSRAGTKADESKVEGFLRNAGGIYVTDPVGPTDAEAYGFDGPSARIELTLGTGDASETPGAVTELIIGGDVPDRENYVYITKSDFDFTATISRVSVQRILDDELSDLLP